MAIEIVVERSNQARVFFVLCAIIETPYDH